VLSWQLKFLDRFSQVFDLNQCAGLDEMSTDGSAKTVPEKSNEHNIAETDEQERLQKIDLEFRN
jgi:hypothetical protein